MVSTRSKSTARRASEVIEIVDESNNVILIFSDPLTFADYEAAELNGTDFDYARIEQQVQDLSAKLDSFLDDLRKLYPPASR